MQVASEGVGANRQRVSIVGRPRRGHQRPIVALSMRCRRLGVQKGAETLTFAANSPTSSTFVVRAERACALLLKAPCLTGGGCRPKRQPSETPALIEQPGARLKRD